MTPDEARERFQQALDEELSTEERAAFERALEASPSLREEYEALREVVLEARALHDAAPAVDLLAGIQRELRQRSGGRFYRDRFAELRGRGALVPLVLVGAALFVVAALLAWVLLL